MSEASVTLRTLVCLLFRRRRHVGGVVVEVLVPLEQLLLPEALVALVALVGLLVSVYQHVGLQVPLGDRAVRTQVALEAFLTLVSFLVHFQGVPATVMLSLIRCITETITVITCLENSCHTFYNASVSRWCAASARGASSLFCGRTWSDKVRTGTRACHRCG